MARRSKHGQALNAAELCRRLEALEMERGAADRKAKRESKEQRQTSVPYHHVPQHAAKDFARTTSSEVQRKRESQALSSSLPSFGQVDDTCRQNIKRQSLGPNFAPKHTLARSEGTSGLDYGQSMGRRASRSGLDVNKVQHERRTEKSGHLIYESLLGADEGFRRLRIREGVLTELATIESVLHEDVTVLAHKINRQHLEDRAGADWTQRAECGNESKYDALKGLAAPLLRSLAKRGNVDNDLEKPPDAKSLSKRRPSFLARHFRKRTLD